MRGTLDYDREHEDSPTMTRKRGCGLWALMANSGDERLVRSKQRVADHGEVFTPEWIVDAMLNLVKAETERIDSRFLEPACGSGNFLVQVLLANSKPSNTSTAGASSRSAIMRF